VNVSFSLNENTCKEKKSHPERISMMTDNQLHQAESFREVNKQ